MKMKAKYLTQTIRLNFTNNFIAYLLYVHDYDTNGVSFPYIISGFHIKFYVIQWVTREIKYVHIRL